MVARFLVGLWLVLVFAAGAEAQEPEPGPVLTEREAVARALRRAPLRDTLEGDVTAEEGRGWAAGAYPNPQLAYMREQTFGASGSREDYVSLSQALDLGARRALQGEAGGARARAARREGEATGLSVAAQARLRFHEVLYRQARINALEGWGGRIEQALTFVTRREQRGDAATYDRRRVERERAVAMGRLETERAALERARARLQALLGADASTMTVTGTLLPDTEPAELLALRASNGSRPDLLALDLRLEAATLERRAASRWWAPDLLLEGGWKGVDLGGQGRTDGFLFGASLSLPLWDRASGLARVAAGEAQAARGRRALLESELDGELAGARAEAVRLRRAASEFHERTTEVSGELVRIASAGYEGGELGLLELLDAHRGATDDSLTALDMAHAARRARIELDRLTGAGLP
ncbi:outer membrane efflux protein [Cystobacter fuscus]|uniref:Outer membrane efflux protein n=1 Tax=Cystobacter fuscus TaxID=43 RepID=A0A250J7U3_9BACT|nr:TolC family protein [Cystobacter fuscus]ATB39663.1 outer membrane efflux protein [Cystobacter fuscus]